MRVREEIGGFAARLSAGMKRPQRKFLLQMLYGIQASKDVKLSNIGRSLKEGIALIKTEGRLSRQVKGRDLAEGLRGRMLEWAGCKVKKETVLAVDLSDVRKEYGEKMEKVAWVHDGSRGGEIVRGYWLLGIFAAEVAGEGVLPLWSELYSTEAEGFAGENRQLLGAIHDVAGAVGKKGIWAIDRGGDRKTVLNGFLSGDLRFVARLVGKRHLVSGDGMVLSAEELARGMECKQRVKLVVQQEGVKERREAWLGMRRVRLPWREEVLRLVVVKGFGEKPMMLLTNALKAPEEILEIYLTRWKCEESYRFIKQSYHLEDVRVRSYVGLRNMVALVQAVFYFLAVELGERLGVSVLVRKICERARRFFAVAEFKYYALADGIYWTLVGARAGPELPADKKLNVAQLLLPFLD